MAGRDEDGNGTIEWDEFSKIFEVAAKCAEKSALLIDESGVRLKGYGGPFRSSEHFMMIYISTKLCSTVLR